MVGDKVKTEEIQIRSKIYTIRGAQVMLDRDLAELYGVETKRLNEQVKRNIGRFPERFRFKLSPKEKDEVVANCDHLQSLKFSRTNPFVFTEQGVAMLSAILRSEVAIDVSIKIIDAFIQMRRFISENSLIFQKIGEIERRLLLTDSRLDSVLNALELKEAKPKQGIFYNGQVFDAYTFVSDLGLKIFAFSKLEKENLRILEKLD